MPPPLISPINGVPWRRFKPPLPPPDVHPSPPATPLERPAINHLIPFRGPLGLPWQVGHIVPVPVFAPPQPTAPTGTNDGFVPQRPGPAIRSVPWLVRNQFLSPPGVRIPPPSPPPAPPPVNPKAGVEKPFIPRDPLPDPRMRRFTEVLSSWFNYNLAQGIIYQVDAKAWGFDVEAAGGQSGTGGLTGRFTDSFGVQ